MQQSRSGNSGWRRVLVALLVMMGMFTVIASVNVATADTASASPVESCTGVLGAIGVSATGIGLAITAMAAASGYECGTWLGDQYARFICWASWQWWGGAYRSSIYYLTGGKYSRC